MGLPIHPTEAGKSSEWAKCWIPENEPEFIEFEEALDEFSQSTMGMSWSRAMARPSPDRPWSESQAHLFAAALKRAPKALATAPYRTVVKLFQMKNLADDQNKAAEAFWESLDNACAAFASPKNH